jgi:hypothetical protein
MAVAAAALAAGCGGGSGPPAGTAGPTRDASSTIGSGPPGGTAGPTRDASPTIGSSPLNAAERAWLAAIPTFMGKVDKALGRQNEYLTPTKLREYANLHRGCRRDLARGLPSRRLRPVHALVLKACGEYDKGAACFAAAARIGAPLAGSAEDRAFVRALDCGFAAHGKGLPSLGDAINKGEEIRMVAD